MKITEEKLRNLQRMIEKYEKNNLSVDVSVGENVNCTGCSGHCSGSCNNFCTSTCRNYCDGSGKGCWKSHYYS